MDKNGLVDEWRTKWAAKEITVEEAIRKIIPGNRVYIGTGCSEPQALTTELIRQSDSLLDIEIIHFLTIWPEKYFTEKAEDQFRHNAFFIGSADLREEINKGQSDYTPIYTNEIPSLFLSGRKYIDVALIQVSPPDRFGFCSYGINVDSSKQIAKSAYLTIAEINPQMPRTSGNSMIHMKEIDYFVYNDTPLLEFHFKERNVSERIGKNVANLIENKSTIGIAMGTLPNACLKYLMDKKDLGMHSHFITDNIIPLIENGVLTCRKKNFHPEKVITSFALGTKKLFDFINNNPYIEFYTTDYICNPYNISQNDKMVSIIQAFEIDLTGQVNASTKGYNFYTGIGDSVDFMRGAALSKGGKPIIVLPSTTLNEKRSKIVPQLEKGAGIMFPRADIHYVVTEWGVAYLHGKTIRDRVLELILIAHPKFRQELLVEAKKLNYIYSDQQLSCDEEGNICIYPRRYETIITLDQNERIFIRPVKTTDEATLKDLYYSLNERDRYLRFFSFKKEFPHSKTQNEVNIDYEKTFSIGAFVGDFPDQEMVGNATYYLDKKINIAEISFVVKDKWREKGLGSYLLNYLIMIAKEKGIKGFYGTIHIENKTTIHIFKKFGNIKIHAPIAGENDIIFELFFEKI